MTRLARLLLSTALLLLAACGFNDAQKVAFVRAMTEAILNATDTSSVVVARTPVAMAAPATANPAGSAVPLICTKLKTHEKCPKHSLTRVVRETASLRQSSRLVRLHRASSARVRCEIAAAAEAVRRGNAARQFVFRTQTITPDVLAPLPGAAQFVICTDRDLVNQTGFVFETVGG